MKRGTYFAVYRTSTGRIERWGRRSSFTEIPAPRGRSVWYGRRPVDGRRHRILNGHLAQKPVLEVPVLQELERVVLDIPRGVICDSPLRLVSGRYALRLSSRYAMRFEHPDYYVPSVQVQPRSRGLVSNVGNGDNGNGNGDNGRGHGRGRGRE